MPHALRLAAALAVAALAAACGPMEPGDEPAVPSDAPLLRSSGGGGGPVTALALPSTALEAGAVITGTVTAGSGVLVYLTYPKGLFAGPGWVRVPQGSASATFTLHVSPYVTTATAATISARTTTPDAAGYQARAVTVLPPAAPPAARAQVASATFSATTLPTGTSATCTLALSAPAPAAGAAVLVAISNDFLGLDADVPPVVVIPPGATTATFTVHAHLASAASTAATEIVVANLFGGAFQGAALQVVR